MDSSAHENCDRSGETVAHECSWFADKIRLRLQPDGDAVAAEIASLTTAAVNGIRPIARVDRGHVGIVPTIAPGS